MQILKMGEVVLNFRAITSRSDDVVGRQCFSFIVIFLLTILVIGCHTQTSVSADPASAKPQVVSDTAVRVSEADLSNWKTYRNKQYGIELKYPETWTVGGEGSGTNEPTGQSAQRTTVWMIGFRKPHRDGEPDVYLTLSIQANENPRKLTIRRVRRRTVANNEEYVSIDWPYDRRRTTRRLDRGDQQSGKETARHLLLIA